MPSIVAPGTPFSRKAILISGVVLLFASFAAILFGMQSTTVGEEGLRNHGILGAGFIGFGVTMLLFGSVFAMDAWTSRPRGSEAVRDCAIAILSETGKLGATVIIYGGCALVALGALSSLDRADSTFDVVFRLAVIALCIAAIVLWRRRNKKHPRTYQTIGPFWLILFMLAMAALGALGGSMTFSEYAADRASGPQTSLCWLSGVEENRPSGRYRALSPTTLEIEFTALEDGTSRRVSISEHDRTALEEIVDSGGTCYLTYYPASRIFVSAEPV